NGIELVGGEVLKGDALDANVRFAADQQEGNAVAHRAQVAIVEDHLLAATGHAAVAAAAARRDVEAVRLESDVAAGRARDADRQALVVGAAVDVHRRPRAGRAHRLLDRPPRLRGRAGIGVVPAG